MEIGKNIAKYRKAKGWTQEELGSRLGVTNQAVSKWESGISMPDISLLPTLTSTLGISFEALYGLDEPDESQPERIPPDEFPERAYDALHNAFQRFWNPAWYANWERRNVDITQKLEDGWRFTCVSNTHGAVEAAGTFAYIDLAYKKEGSEAIFSNDRCASALRKLADPNVRKVLAYEYAVVMKEARNDFCRPFTVTEIAAACGLTVEETEDAIGSLLQFEINEKESMPGEQTTYLLRSPGCHGALSIFHAAELLASDHMWYALRDTQVISDSSFIGE